VKFVLNCSCQQQTCTENHRFSHRAVVPSHDRSWLTDNAHELTKPLLVSTLLTNSPQSESNSLPSNQQTHSTSHDYGTISGVTLNRYSFDLQESTVKMVKWPLINLEMGTFLSIGTHGAQATVYSL